MADDYSLGVSFLSEYYVFYVHMNSVVSHEQSRVE